MESMSTTITRDEFADRIARLEAELEELKKDYEKMHDADKAARPRTFADLAGIFKGEFGLTYEEIKEHEYRIPERRLRMFDDDYKP